MSTFTKKSFGASGLFPVNPDLPFLPRGVVRAPKPICPRCGLRPSKYALCDERGDKISDWGLCEQCQYPQAPDEDELMRVAIHTERAHATPADEATLAAAHADFDAYKQACNDAWHNADALLGELEEKRARFNYLCKIGPEADETEMQELAARIDEIEGDYVFLDELPSAPPFPDAL